MITRSEKNEEGVLRSFKEIVNKRTWNDYYKKGVLDTKDEHQ